MASEPIHINDDSALPRLFDEAAEGPVVFERKGRVYRLTAVEENGTDRPYDPEALRAAIEEVSGIISEEEGEEWIRKIYEYRRIGSRTEPVP